VKPLIRRYQVVPGWWYCRECPERHDGGELDARQHTVIYGHETRHVRTAQVILRLNPPAQRAATDATGDGPGDGAALSPRSTIRSSTP
jgi:hypothetical protein